MALEPGSTLGHYEILASLGAGGMGEVYRARDPKLEREVAIKVLPEDFATDPERLARFEREAKALAALNHPNVATVHGFERDGDTHFLVMELVEGEELAERIRRGPIPVEEAVPWFVQIAEGLEAAHEKGIVHRDLKPANVKVTEDGRAKVLDFGLAKAMEPTVFGETELSESPTRTAATMRGAIMGTAAYMSPEQARGQDVDKRADVWAFGCCLFEAVSGRSAFGESTVSDTLASVLKEEPDWQRLPAETPAAIRRLLERCLVKSRRDRLRDVGDARIELASSDLDSSNAPTESSTETRAGRRARWTLPAGALLIGALAGAGLIYSLLNWRASPSTSGGSQEVLRYSIRMNGLRPGFVGEDGVVTWAPDGSALAITAGSGVGSQLYVRDRSSLQFRNLSEASGAWYKSFSPDSQWLMYGSIGDEILYRVPRAGGTPLRVTQGTEIFGQDWDGMTHAVLSTVSGLRRVPIGGGDREIVTETTPGEDFLAHRFPQVLPDGRGVLFSLVSGSSPEESGIAVVDESGFVRTLLQGGIYGRFVSPGYLVYWSEDALFAVPMELSTLEIEGTPVRVVEGVVAGPSYGVAAYSVSAEGTLAYVPSSIVETLRTGIVSIDRRGQGRRLPIEPGMYAEPSLSPDGTSVALFVSPASQIFVFDLSTGHPVQVTREGSNYSTVWTPDGRSLIFLSGRDGVWDIYRKSVFGTEEAVRLTFLGQEGEELRPTSLSESRILTVRRDSPGQGYDISTIDLNGSGELRPFVTRSGHASNAQFSPDGQWVAYEVWERGRPEVFVQPYPATADRRRISRDGGRSPAWSAAERELFYLEGHDRMMSVRYDEREGVFVPGAPEVLFEYPIHDVGSGNPLFDVTRDGQRFIAVETQDLSKGEIIVVENWVEELQRLVPSGK